MRYLSALALAVLLIPATQLLADPPDATHKLDQTINVLENDHPFIEIEVTIAQWTNAAAEDQPTAAEPKLEGTQEEVAAQIAELQKSRRLSNIQRIRLVAPNQQQALVQIGMEQPRVTGSQFGPRGNAMNSISYSSMGTLVRAKPRLLHERRIAVDLEVTKSGLTAAADAPVLAENDSGRQVKADAMRTLTVNTIAAVTEGHTIIVSGSQQPGEGELVLLSARIKQ